jgi:7-carboxy-7-deazaguanine synthase
MSLRITEIFASIQGETTFSGLPTTFVRLTGCPLRCTYCDTEYAFHGGERMSVDAVLETVETHGLTAVCVTGGEPLAQPEVHTLLSALCDSGYRVSLETSGALDIAAVDERVARIVDFKTPASGESTRNLWSNVRHLRSRDEVKFVVCDRADYDWARFKIDEHELSRRAGEVLFSPSADGLAPADLAAWIVEDRLPVRMQLQLHKIIWGDEPGR